MYSPQVEHKWEFFSTKEIKNNYSQDIVKASKYSLQIDQLKNFTPIFILSKVNQDVFDNMILNCFEIWVNEFHTEDIQHPISSELFIEKIATRIRLKQQSKEESINLLRSIIIPSNNGFVSFNYLCKFMAMFGPEHKLMSNIESLLNFSNKTGNWMKFDTKSNLDNMFFASFEEDQPNYKYQTFNNNSQKIPNNNHL